ncbi:hypothetical protein OGATHE_000072 [Ogataea polymorpha]|uniref:Uncharacterized protein n=1 Tax=Ogataea polymorpha TaxID=460523 RepID=A0A9P8PUW2_9ASCO|nr:hypothetical protein OGATHE_000072 [Ogataea polymorpha]
MENRTPPIGDANATATPAAEPAVRNCDSETGRANDLMMSVCHPRNPSMANPETMHLTSEIPDPAAVGAKTLQRRAAILPNMTDIKMNMRYWRNELLDHGCHREHFPSSLQQQNSLLR